MITDKGLEFNRQWEAIANSSISGSDAPQPTVYTATDGTVSKSGALEVAITGGSYSAMMAATHRPLLPVFDTTKIFCSLAFNINLDPKAPTVAQALESEGAYTFTDANGISWQMPTYWQLNIEEKGMVQGYTTAAPWLDTGIKIPIPTPGTPYPIKISYCLNVPAKTSSVLGFVANGVKYAMPAAFQNVAAVQENKVDNVGVWQPGVYIQFQSDLAYKGGSMTNKYTGVDFNWE
jgi:hypothetical protein